MGIRPYLGRWHRRIQLHLRDLRNFARITPGVPEKAPGVLMALPYENATSGDKALGEMQKILQKFGCQSFGSMMDFENGKLIVQFRYRDMPISVEASAKGYAAAWLKENPWNNKRNLNRPKYEEKAMAIGRVAVYSILRDWIKGQIMAIETGILSFEGAFLGQILLPSGKTVLQHATESKMIQITGPGDV